LARSEKKESSLHQKRVFRFWYYLSVGIGNYIGVPIAAFNLIFLIYLMLINISPIFARYALYFFSIITVALIVLGTFFGLFHFKKSQAFAAQVDVTVLNNPWYYKAFPGMNQEIIIPLKMLTLKGLKRLSKDPLDLTNEESELINFLLDKGKDILDGGMIREKFIKDKRKILMDKILESIE